MLAQVAEPIIPRVTPTASSPLFDPFDLGRVRSDVVEPVVAALLKPGELEDLKVTWGHRSDQDDLSVMLTARGETFRDALWSPDWVGCDTAAGVARRLADHLEDWLCETVFAWGEQRLVPAAVLDALPDA